jgi:peptidoglycan/LPS O-acetylase OafA/YrhL
MSISQLKSCNPKTYRLGSRDSEWIRVLASVFVLIHHLNPWASRLLENPGLQLLADWGANYSVGWFWVYSGFVFDWVYNNESNRSSIGFKVVPFIIKRIRRLYPLHVITLILILTITYFENSHVRVVTTVNSLVLNFLLLQNISGGGAEKSINPVMWSVSLELVAYAFFYCWVRYLGGSRLWSILVLIASLITVKLIGFGQNPASAILLFFGGTVLSWLYKRDQQILQIVTVVIASLMLVFVGSKYSTFYPLSVVGTISIFIASGYFIKNSSFFQFLADRTYTLYVTHTLVIWVVVQCHFTNQYFAACTYFLCSWCLSILIDQAIVKDIYSRCLRAFIEKLIGKKPH